MRWTLEEIELQAVRGGVNRQQAEQMLDRIAELEGAIVAHRAALTCPPVSWDLFGADLRLWEHLND